MNITPNTLLGYTNGKICTPNGPGDSLRISLPTLKSLLTTKSLLGAPLTEHGILAIIGYGSAFKPLEVVEVKRWWGKLEQRFVYTNPHDVDIMVITQQPVEPWVRNYKPVYSYGDYGCVIAVAAAGIHMVARGFDQFVAGIDNGEDPVSISALTQGVILAEDCPRLSIRFPAVSFAPQRGGWSISMCNHQKVQLTKCMCGEVYIGAGPCPRYIINLADTMEANGHTIRENNLARQHDTPIGALVELKSGIRIFVVQHSRDCDGTPLYDLGLNIKRTGVVIVGDQKDVLMRHYPRASFQEVQAYV